MRALYQEEILNVEDELAYVFVEKYNIKIYLNKQDVSEWINFTEAIPLCDNISGLDCVRRGLSSGLL